MPKAVPSASELGFPSLWDWAMANPQRADSDSGTISSGDLPPALPDLRAVVRLAGPAAPLGSAKNTGPAIRRLVLEMALDNLCVPKTCATWAYALQFAVGLVPRLAPGGQVPPWRGVR